MIGEVAVTLIVVLTAVALNTWVVSAALWVELPSNLAVTLYVISSTESIVFVLTPLIMNVKLSYSLPLTLPVKVAGSPTVILISSIVTITGDFSDTEILLANGTAAL